MHSPIDIIIVNHSFEFVKIFFDFFNCRKRNIFLPFVSLQIVSYEPQVLNTLAAPLTSARWSNPQKRLTPQTFSLQR